MSGVEAARVHLVLPHESLFSDRERVAKAGVVLKLRGARLNDQLTASVANLVSSAWDDLSPQNVTVVTTDGQMPNQGHTHSATLPGLQDLETTLAERVVLTLAPVVGSDHVKSSVTIEYDPNSGESTQEIYDPANSAVLSSQSSQETVGDLEPAGIPGTASNAPNSQANTTAVAQAKSATSTQGIRSDNKTFAVSRTTRHVLEPAGRVKRIAAAILVDDAIETKTENGKAQETRRKRTADEMKQIEELAKAAVGFDLKRGDQFSLQNISFTQAPVDVPAPVGRMQRVLIFAERWTGLLRYAVLLVLFAMIYLLLLRPMKKQVVALLQAPLQSSLSAAGTSGGASVPLVGAGVHVALPPPTVTIDGEVQQAVALKKQLVGKVKEDPAAASRLIQNWMRETEIRK